MNHKVSYNLRVSTKKISLTLTVPNDTDAKTWLHDIVAIRIAESGRFIGDVFECRRTLIATRSGDFAPRYKKHSETPEGGGE